MHNGIKALHKAQAGVKKWGIQVHRRMANAVCKRLKSSVEKKERQASKRSIREAGY